MTGNGRDAIGSRLSASAVMVSHALHMAHWLAETPNIWQSSPNSCWQRSAQWILPRQPASLHLPVFLEYFCSMYISSDVAIAVLSQNTVINIICMTLDSERKNKVLKHESEDMILEKRKN